MNEPPRQVYLPLAKFEKCHTCAKTGTLKLCAACGERTYCSAECQKKDWPAHKLICGKTNRIAIDTFYPLLASFSELLQTNGKKPPHPGLRRTIINSPNPGAHPVLFPDGSAAKLVMFGDFINPLELGTSTWWPNAFSDKVRRKLMRRIAYEGYALSVATAICLALLSGMYTTTATAASESGDGKPKRRSRLTYKSSPIADFGVVKGAVNVKNQDKLAYLNVSDMSFFNGQDPNEHHWVYFTTLGGQDILLDCSMFTFNMCLCVNTYPYLPKSLNLPFHSPLSFAPALFRDPTMDRFAPSLHTERKRMSVLRNSDMKLVVGRSADGFSYDDVALVRGFMETFAERTLSEVEVDLTVSCAGQSGRILTMVVETRSWTGWPAEPPLGIEEDPGELRHNSFEGDDEEWFEYMRKFRKKHNKPDADREALGRAYRKWKAQNAAKGNGN